MKKVLLSLLLIFTILNITSFAAFAQNQINNQKLLDVDCTEYKNLCLLYLLEGKALPNSTGPWSTDELKNMMSVLKGSYDNSTTQQLYDTTKSLLDNQIDHTLSDNLCFTIHGYFNPESYIHTNKTDFTKETDWNYDYEHRKEALTFEGELWTSSLLYFYTDMGLFYINGTNEENSVNKLYNNNFVCNIPYTTKTTFNDISLNFPKRSFISLGGNHWNLSAGRYVNRWGNGETGNLFLGGNALYDDTLRLSTYFNPFKYTMIGIFYPHSEYETNINQNQLVKGLKLYFAHRFDFCIYQRVNLSLTEGVMYQSANGAGDFSIFNPMILYHNLYIRSNANSIMSFEADYTITNGLNLYTQIVMDELAFWGEPKDGDQAHPNKMGYMLGAKYVYSLPIGVLKLNLEGVYTDPCLYLREKYNSTTQQYGVSFYGTIREFTNYSPSINYLRNCIGYKYGGDSVVADFKASLFSNYNWNTNTEVFYMAHGIMYNDLNTDTLVKPKNTSPSTYDATATYPDGEIEHFIRFSLSGDYQVFKWLYVYAGVDNWFILNKDNQSKDWVYDLQLYSGIKLTL